MKEYILVSACLLGHNTKYNGGNNYIEKIELLKTKYEIIPFCAEQEGGLSTPRIPSEIKGDKVINKIGIDVSRQFQLGASKCLEMAKKYGIKLALLKESSPSCGVHKIYNGLFDGTKIDGMGITARLLFENGIKIYSENEIDELL